MALHKRSGRTRGGSRGPFDLEIHRVSGKRVIEEGEEVLESLVRFENRASVENVPKQDAALGISREIAGMDSDAVMPRNVDQQRQSPLELRGWRDTKLVDPGGDYRGSGFQREPMLIVIGPQVSSCCLGVSIL